MSLMCHQRQKGLLYSPTQREGVKGDDRILAGKLQTCRHLRLVQLGAKELLEEYEAIIYSKFIYLRNTLRTPQECIQVGLEHHPTFSWVVVPQWNVNIHSNTNSGVYHAGQQPAHLEQSEECCRSEERRVGKEC